MSDWQRLCSAVLVTFVAGCSGGYDEAPTAEAEAPPAAQEAAPAAPAPAREMVREEAKAGVGAKGRIEGEGILVTPVKTYFLAKEKITFDIQVAQAMNLYKGEHGFAPKTEEEFWEKIIRFNQIALPELPEGHRYVYDVEKEDLMVEHAAQ